MTEAEAIVEYEKDFICYYNWLYIQQLIYSGTSLREWLDFER